MKIEEIYEIYKNASAVTTDTRKIISGAIFFALKGDKFDGNKYAKEAINKGCKFAIVDDKTVVNSKSFILVDNVLSCLQQLAKYHRQQLNIPIIAITGTNGKTTTKELISSVLIKKYKIGSTQGNFNNHIGVPLTLLSFNKETEIGIVEMGANHPLEIKELCQIALPNYGIITNIGKAHIEGFGSFENIIKTKRELFDFIKISNGKVFYNSTNKLLQEAVNDLELDTIAFGKKDSSVRGEILPSNKYLKLNLSIGNSTENVTTQLIGNYNLENILAAACIGNYFRVSNLNIISAIQEYKPQNNRSEFIQTTSNNLYLDAYNANPTSVKAALDNFISLNLNNKVVILGDMLELGIESKKEHEKIIKFISLQDFKRILLVGRIYSSLETPDSITTFDNINELITWIESNKIYNSNVLVKGSRGIQLEQIVDNL